MTLRHVLPALATFTLTACPSEETASSTCTGGQFRIAVAGVQLERFDDDGALACAYTDERALYLFWSLPADLVTVADVVATFPQVAGDPDPHLENVDTPASGVRFHAIGPEGELSALAVSDGNTVAIAVVFGVALAANERAKEFLDALEAETGVKTSELRRPIQKTSSALRGVSCEIDAAFSARCNNHLNTASLCAFYEIIPVAGPVIEKLCRDSATELRRRSCDRGTCGTNELCISGICCAIGESVCGSACYSPNNCHVCRDGVVSSACNGCSRCKVASLLYTPGECEPSSCSSRETCCGTQCFNLDRDEENCGTCGNTCPRGQLCEGGVCKHYCPLCRKWDEAAGECVEACDASQCEICSVNTEMSPPYTCESGCTAAQTCFNNMCRESCTPCTGFDGFVDCCTADQTCHTEPIKGPPCRD